MLKIIINAFILFSFISPCFSTNGARKYDVESEAIKLYGEDFKSVLRRFRKTPDYLKILTDKLEELKIYVKEMSIQVLNHIMSKMMQRVNDLIGVTSPYEESTTTAAPMYYHAYNRRQEEPETPEPEEPAEPAEPTGPTEEDEKNLKEIRSLDDYHMFNHPLTTQERNSFRDIGFEFAGQLIHAIIKHMGPVETGPKITKQPFGGQEPDKSVSTSTEHPHTHEVTIESTAGETHLPEETTETTPETFRFRYKKKKGSRSLS